MFAELFADYPRLFPAFLSGLTRGDVEQAIIDGHDHREVNDGQADWLLTAITSDSGRHFRGWSRALIAGCVVTASSLVDDQALNWRVARSRLREG